MILCFEFINKLKIKKTQIINAENDITHWRIFYTEKSFDCQRTRDFRSRNSRVQYVQNPTVYDVSGLSVFRKFPDAVVQTAGAE